MKRIAIVISGTLAFSLAATATDYGQMDTFLGYTFTRFNSSSTLPSYNANGGSAQWAYNFNKWFSEVIDAGAVTASGSGGARTFSQVDVNRTVVNILGGRRVSMRPIWIRFGGWTASVLFTVLRASDPCVIAAFAESNSQMTDSAAPTTALPPKIGRTWVALSSTAMAITGDVTLAANTIIIRRRAFPLKLVREVGKQHLEDVGRIFDLSRGEPLSSARLYRTRISRRSTLLNGNTICGPDADARWMLAVYAKTTFVPEGGLFLAFFSGDNEPNLDIKAVSLCGTFSYMRPDWADWQKNNAKR